MANDIIGAPEIVVIKGRVFRFSPLNDYENAELEAWVKWRVEKQLSVFDEEALTELATLQGAAQLLYQSVKRTEPGCWSILSLAEFLAEDKQACDEVFEAWCKLNFVDLKLPESGSTKTSDKPSKYQNDDLYTLLSAKYNWTPHQIALMTKYQQVAYLKAIVGDNSDGLFFATEEEYDKFRANKLPVK